MYKQETMEKLIWLGVVHAKKHSIWMPKAEGLRILGQLGIHSNLQASLDCNSKPLFEMGRERRNILTGMLGGILLEHVFPDFILSDMHHLFKIKKFKVNAKMD